MSLFIALLQGLVLFAVAPLLSGIVRVARARALTAVDRGATGVSRYPETAGPPERRS